MLINSHCGSAKVEPNTTRHIFASNNLEYNKLKASTLRLHVTNYIAKSQIMYKLCISKNCKIFWVKKNSEIEFSSLLCCPKQVIFFRFILRIKKASIVLTNYYSNVKAHAMKKLYRFPKNGNHFCGLGWKKRFVLIHSLRKCKKLFHRF